MNITIRTTLLWLFVMITAGSVCAQTRGELTVIKDPMIDSLIAKRLEFSKKSITPSVPAKAPNTAVVSAYGYRVQIFYGSDRREAFNQQARFKNLYPKYNSYITYREPNYYLRAGDFRSRLEAQSFLNELRPIFPTLFIFREKINAPDPER